MQKKVLFMASLVLLLCTVACHEPIYSEQPVYGKLRFTTEAPSTITLDKQGEIGKSSICNRL